MGRQLKLFGGGYATCPDCGRNLGVRMHSYSGTMQARSWTTTHTVIENMIRGAAPDIADDKTVKFNKISQTQETVPVKYVTCSLCGRRVVNRVYWMEYADGHISKHLCKQCLDAAVNTSDSDDAVLASSRVFSYSVSSDSLDNFQYAYKQLLKKSEEVSEPQDISGGVSDLF